MDPHPSPIATNRVACIDALRGFDMFWIVGGKPLLLALAAAMIHANEPPGVAKGAIGTHSLGGLHLLRSDQSAVLVHCWHSDAILIRQASRNGHAAPRDLPAYGLAFRHAMGIRHDGSG